MGYGQLMLKRPKLSDEGFQGRVSKGKFWVRVAECTHSASDRGMVR